MFWFEKKPEKIENPKGFIVDVLHRYKRAEPGDGGMQLGRYIAAIKDKTLKEKFNNAIVELMKDKSKEKWVKGELRSALAEELDVQFEKVTSLLRTVKEPEIFTNTVFHLLDIMDSSLERGWKPPSTPSTS